MAIAIVIPLYVSSTVFLSLEFNSSAVQGHLTHPSFPSVPFTTTFLSFFPFHYLSNLSPPLNYTSLSLSLLGVSAIRNPIHLLNLNISNSTFSKWHPRPL